MAKAKTPHPPDVPAPPWQRVPAARAARRRDPLTREAIVKTALRLLDRDGLDELSMRRIADELRTGAASLYWHVGSKDGLLDLLFDEVLGEMSAPDADSTRWKEQIKEVARAARARIKRHRDIVRISIGSPPMGPNGLRYAERVLAIFRASGLPDRLTTVANQLLFSVINGFILDEAGDRIMATERPGADVASRVAGYVRSLPRDHFPNLVAVAPYIAAGTADERFELLLDFFVDGLEHRRAAGSAR